MISINQLCKSFDDKVVLNDLTLTIEDCSVTGLVGPNGCGKTTLLSLLNGVLFADSGSITYDDLPVNDAPNVKKDILLISDDPYYHHNETLNSLKEFYKVWYKDFNEAIFNEYVTKFELPTKKPLKNFSKGMKRQSMLCIAFAISPKYLFLDEAFDGLDPIKRLSIKKAIAAAVEEHHMTVIISSHNLRELEDICDHYCIIHKGTLLEAGSLIDDSNNIHKIQLAYNKEVTRSMFEPLDILSFNRTGKVVNLVVKGEIEEINEVISKTEPVMQEVLPVNLEELFIYEVESMEGETNV